MSGGSYNYIYLRVKDECEGAMYDDTLNEMIPDLCEVLHALEWWQSCDSSEKKYREEVEKFKKKWIKEDIKMKKDYSKEIHATKHYLMELDTLQGKLRPLVPVMFPEGGTVECQDIKVELDGTDICMIMAALSSCKAEVLKWLEEKGEEQWKG